MVKKPVIVTSRDWQDLIGIQFALGGSDPASGLNCYGLVREVYKGLQIELPARQETSLDAETAIEAAGNDWTPIAAPQPFAVALIRSEGNSSTYHLGIVTPEMTLLHSMPRKGVIVSRLDDYSSRIIGFYCYTPGEGERLPLADGTAGRIIGTILIVAATIYTGGAAAAAFGGWSTGLGAFAGAVAGMAVSMAGNMILNAIAPMEQNNNLLSGNSSMSDSRTYTWDGIQNDARQGLVKALLFGRIKVGGQVISEKTWFDSRNNEYLDMLICPCVGRVTRFMGIAVNDTSVALYKNTAPVFRPGDDQQLPINMFRRIYVQYSSAAKVPYDASSSAPTAALQFSTKSPAGGVRLTITAPNGLYHASGNDLIADTVTFRVQYKERTATEWSDLPAVDPDYSTVYPFIHRSGGVFTGSGNPYHLADTGAGFASSIPAGADFELTIGATIYYCTQVSTLTEDAVSFNAFTDAGQTTPVTGALTDGEYSITNGAVDPFSTEIDVYYPDYYTPDGGGGDGGAGPGTGGDGGDGGGTPGGNGGDAAGGDGGDGSGGSGTA